MNLLWLQDPLARNLALTGGKGATLAALAAHMPVPPGFCITTAASRDHAELEPALAREILAMYAQLSAHSGGTPATVAVRSSGADEDGQQASFAGQHETLLGVTGGPALLEAVQRCWASSDSEQARAYRAKQGLPSKAPIAVVVQVLVAADVAGVAFSMDPVSGVRDRVVINAAWGLGSAVVDGRVTPDTFIVSKKTNEVEVLVAEKQVMSVVGLSGTTEVAVPAFVARERSLDDAGARQVAEMAITLEREFGHAVDIEFAFQKGCLFLLQCRPVTTARQNQGEKIPVPEWFPITWDSPSDADAPWQRSPAYIKQATPLLFSAVGVALKGMDAAQRKLERPPASGRYARINTYLYYTRQAEPESAAQRQARNERSLERLLSAAFTLQENWEQTYLPEIKSHLNYLRRQDLSVVPPEGMAVMVSDAAERFRRLWELHHLIVLPVHVVRSEFDELYRELFPQDAPDAPFQLLVGADNQSLRANRELVRLSRHLTAKPHLRASLAGPAWRSELGTTSEGRRFLEALGSWLDEFGYRSEAIDPSLPSWVEDPALVIQMLLAAAESNHLDPEVGLARATREREQAVADTRRRLAGYPSPVRERFERLLSAAQTANMLLEEHNFWIDQMSYASLRQFLLRVGARLYARGLLGDPTDVVMLKLEEIRCTATEGIDRRPLVAERRAEMERWAACSPPGRVGRQPGQVPETIADDPVARAGRKQIGGVPVRSGSPREIHGLAASGGTVRGRARVAHSLTEAMALKPGEILVADRITSAWTPVLARAAGVVADTGGPLSHCAVVVREFGLPAVLSTGSGTRTIRTGEFLEVDGSLGVIRHISECEGVEPTRDEWTTGKR